MNLIKKKSIDRLIDGLSRYEDSRNAVKNSDFTDLKTFVKDYLNTPEPKQRKKLADEFRKRHMELYSFIKDNQELIAAETDMNRIVQAVMSGGSAETDTAKITNLLEMIGESKDDI
ncbi:MAG: hypothetical protein IKQ90_01310 [Ruminococcus sp.]|nr:hypothetical protein [Ruminococcus sp.]